jgi:hypothetical protein
MPLLPFGPSLPAYVAHTALKIDHRDSGRSGTGVAHADGQDHGDMRTMGFHRYEWSLKDLLEQQSMPAGVVSGEVCVDSYS